MFLRRNYLFFLFVLLNFLPHSSFAQNEKNFEGIIKYLFIPDEKFSYQCDTIIHYFGVDNYRIEYRRAPSNLKNEYGTVTDIYYDFRLTPNTFYYFNSRTGLHKIQNNQKGDVENFKTVKLEGNSMESLGYECLKFLHTNEYKPTIEGLTSTFKTDMFSLDAVNLNYNLPEDWNDLFYEGKISLLTGTITESQIPSPYGDSSTIEQAIKWSVAFEIIPQKLSDSIFKLPE